MKLNFIRELVLDRVIYIRANFISKNKRRASFELHKASNRARDDAFHTGPGRRGYT